jgi:hypothetical protein
MTSTN